MKNQKPKPTVFIIDWKQDADSVGWNGEVICDDNIDFNLECEVWKNMNHKWTWFLRDRDRDVWFAKGVENTMQGARGAVKRALIFFYNAPPCACCGADFLSQNFKNDIWMKMHQQWS